MSRRQDTILILNAIQQMSNHVDARLDAVTARIDTLIDSIGDLRQDLAEHIVRGHGGDES